MINIFKKKLPAGTQAIFKISGMHCTSCSMSIDDVLEEIDGVISAQTNYAQSISKVNFDAQKIKIESLIKSIENLGYTVLE